MNLTSMAMSKEERVEKTEMEAAPSLAEEYPYGLKLHLDSQQIKDLGLTGMAELGEEVMIHAKGCVVELSKEQGEGMRMEIQIKDMAVETSDEEKPAPDSDGTSKGKIRSVMSYYG